MLTRIFYSAQRQLEYLLISPFKDVSDSLVADFILNLVNACVQADSVLLHHNLLLNQCIDLLLQEVTLVDVIRLQLLVVFLQVSDVLNDLLQDIVCSLCCMMFQSCAL